MTRWVVFPTLLVAALPFLTVAPASGDAGAATQCVEVGATAFWGVTGWNHFVYVTNRCSQRVVCTVATNIAPQAHEVSVDTNETAQVVTSTNSDVRMFTPVVSCDYAPVSTTNFDS